MNTIMVIVVFAALELYLSKKRRVWMSTEIDEALGERDAFIRSLRTEITDKFDEVTLRAKKARADANRAAVTVDAMKVAAKDVENAIQRASTIGDEPVFTLEVDNVNGIKLLAEGHANLQKQCGILREQCNSIYKAKDHLNNKLALCEKQIGTNKRRIAELAQDASKPPIGKMPGLVPGSAKIVTRPPIHTVPTPPPNETLRETPPPPTTSHCHDGPTNFDS
jgi:hypothetical protein